jgi:hypothetical protein
MCPVGIWSLSSTLSPNHYTKPPIMYTGRGVLLDYAQYAVDHNIEYTNFSIHAITFSAIQAMLQTHSLTPQRGDILFIRMGVIPEWEAYTIAQKQAYAKQQVPSHAGVEATLEVLEWLWDSGFCAVAGDAISWEVYPEQGDVSLHEYLLAGWGCPIGMSFILLI